MDRGVDVGDGADEVQRDRPQPASGFQSRLAGQFAGDVHLEVEDAALDRGIWPGPGQGGADPGPAVGHDDFR